MFSKEAPKPTSPNGTPTLNMISEGTRLTGDIESENDIRVSGSLVGEAKSSGKVIVTSTGSIKGNINAADADVAGEIDGELYVSEKLVLRKTAVINGDIHTKTILVEEGAQITGNCNMGVENGLDTKAAGSPKKASQSVNETVV